MPITGSVNTSFSATSVSTVGLTVTSAVTSQRDNYTFENGTGAGYVTAAFDQAITIASNSTTITLSRTDEPRWLQVHQSTPLATD